MQSIETKNLPSENAMKFEETQSMGSSALPAKSQAENETQKSLSKDLATHLFELSKKVTEDEITPQTVNAACACAKELIKIMEFNLKIRELEREREIEWE